MRSVRQVRHLDPPPTGYANWQSGEVESLVTLWVRLPPRSLTIPWSNGDDTCATCRRRWFDSIRDHSIHGLQVHRQHTSVVRTRTGFNSRADLSMNGLACSMGATDSCKVGGPPCRAVPGFDSHPVHC